MEAPNNNIGASHSKRQKFDEASCSSGSSSPTNKAKIVPTKVINDYQGFSFQDDLSLNKVDTISTEEMTGPTFFDQYISQRKPCVLNALPRLEAKSKSNSKNQQSPETIQITKELLESVAGDQFIQVEKRDHVGENFGQNRSASRQILLTISDFLNRMSRSSNKSKSSSSTAASTKIEGDNKDDKNDISDDNNNDDNEGALLYWSTQEDTDDPFNVPCRQLVDRQLIPAHLSLAGNLILSSCNLWVGKTKTAAKDNNDNDNNPSVATGVSSGLHHDYHDNFYLLLRGRKRFRLFSPDCAPHLATWGSPERIHPNGRVSYVGNETRADGVPLESLREMELDMAAMAAAGGGDDGSDGDDDEEEEELVLGKGFDYVSDDEDGDDFDEGNQKDDFDDIMGQEGEVQEGEKDRSKKSPPSSAAATNDGKDDQQPDERPDSFSRIDPCRTDKKKLEKEFPAFSSCKEVTVEIKAGQMLFLPAGWFHEVTSYSNSTATTGDDKNNDGDPLGDCHMALNYWYHPLDAPNNYANPYQDDFWKKEEHQRLGK